LRLGVVEEPVRLLCPLDRPGKIFGVGLNYQDHAAEGGRSIGEEPVIFSKMPTSLSGPFDPILLPPQSEQVDYEAELVVVIGRKVRWADAKEAAESIFGYAVGNDVSARDWQKGKPGGQWLLGKSFDSFAPIGPGITLASSLRNPLDLKIELRIGDQRLQDSSTSQMVFTPVALVEYLSSVLTLETGDLIFTGTPSGVGVARTPPRFLTEGDLVEVSIESLGTIRNRCHRQSDPRAG
jgi:2-keto-4-pentenoate hydratase/2-oxohepta-3-ene-1,7-dioic acid hydratase in catechol pathway